MKNWQRQWQEFKKHNEIVKLNSLPKSMLKRALWAREQILEHPEKAEIDEIEKLAWVYSKKDDLWYSIAGNYSNSSPEEKMNKKIEAEKRTEWYEKQAKKWEAKTTAKLNYYSKVRKRILERDNWTCQKCGQKIGKLEVHHIVKRKEVRVDTDDNLVTLCITCHRKEDSKEEYGKYEEPPKFIEYNNEI